MRVLFVQQDHMSPTGPVGEAFADHGFDGPAGPHRAGAVVSVARRLAAFLALGGSA